MSQISLPHLYLQLLSGVVTGAACQPTDTSSSPGHLFQVMPTLLGSEPEGRAASLVRSAPDKRLALALPSSFGLAYLP